MGELCLQSGSIDPRRDLVLFLGPSFPEPGGSLPTSGEEGWDGCLWVRTVPIGYLDLIIYLYLGVLKRLILCCLIHIWSC